MTRTAVAFVLISLTALSAWGQAILPTAGNAKPQPGNGAATRVRTSHLDILTYVSNTSVEPGAPFALMLDITPRPRMHVYAPGATNYRAIELAMTPARGVTFRPAQFPPADIYEFVPLNERVPVYQKPFQLVQPVTVGAASRGAAAPVGGDDLTIKATLSYQACDDRICFAPASVPLQWAVVVNRGGK